MTSGKGCRLLIVTPAFHSYHVPIARAFRQLGWDASAFCYDSFTTAEKWELKLRSELPQRLGRPDSGAVAAKISERARAALHTARPDRVLVIKGDVLTETFWDALDRPQVPRTLWLYDELRRTKLTDAILDRVDSIASYSQGDTAALTASGRVAHHIPLAFDDGTAIRPQHLDAVTFVGARYPKREELLVSLHRAGVPVRAFGRDWSTHPFDRARTWSWARPGIPAGRDITLNETYSVMAGSPATLNIHGDQDGFTMRTFEAAGVGGVQLIDRADVAEFYEPGREVAVFSNTDELVELARRAITDDRWGDAMRRAARARTLAEHTFAHRAAALEATWA